MKQGGVQLKGQRECQGIGYAGSMTRLSAYTVSLVFQTTPTLHSLYLPLILFLHMHVALTFLYRSSGSAVVKDSYLGPSISF